MNRINFNILFITKLCIELLTEVKYARYYSMPVLTVATASKAFVAVSKWFSVLPLE